MGRPKVAVVVGARNVGRAVARERLGAGWRVLAVARSRETLELLAEAAPGVVGHRADAADPRAMEEVLRRARAELGGLDLVVNAAGAPPRDQPFGGGPAAEAPPERLQEWLGGYLPAAFTVLRLAGRDMRAARAGTIVQVAGPSARRPGPGRGPFAAAQMGARALTLSMAQELRPHGVHVALLVAEGYVETDRSAGRDPASLIPPAEVARAVAYLAGQPARALTHELVITPAAASWIPTG